MDIRERFLAKIAPVTESGCWIWLGATNNRGYGQFGKGRKIYLAHRTSYELFKGPIPDGLWILHKCDVPSCVNPEHLFVGDRSDNMLDAHKKGRSKGTFQFKETCKNGHDDWLEYGGRRYCRTCRNSSARSRRHANSQRV